MLPKGQADIIRVEDASFFKAFQKGDEHKTHYFDSFYAVLDDLSFGQILDCAPNRQPYML